MFSPSSFATFASISVGEVLAKSSVLTRIAVTFVDFLFTKVSHIALMTNTPERVIFRNTMSVETRIGMTLIYKHFTISSIRPRFASALISIDQIFASSSVSTGIAFALLDLLFANQSRVSRMTDTSESVVTVNAVAVKTWIGIALVDMFLAVLTPSSFATMTLVAVGQIFTSARVFARIAGTIVDLLVAQESTESRMTRTPEGVLAVNTVSIDTGIGIAFVDSVLTIGSPSSFSTMTLESIDQIFTSSTIFTRIICTIINLFIAKRPSETRMTRTPEEIVVIDTDSILARIVITVIPIEFAPSAMKSGRTLTVIGSE